MNISEKLLLFFQYICRFNFGNFESEELKKFIRLGLIFGLIIGVHWTLVTLKDSIFIQLVDSLQLPYVKMVTVPFLVPLVIFYNKLFKSTSRDKMMVIVPAFYGFTILGFSLLVSMIQIPAAQIAKLPLAPYIFTKAFGYLWYVFVESYGSLVIALFWAFATDLTDPAHAKRGFPLIYAMGQVGGIIFPYTIGSLPYRLNLQTDTISMVISALLTLLIIPLGRYFLRVTPKSLLASYSGKIEEKEDPKQKAKFFDDLKIILKNRYLLGIFMSIFIYQLVIIIFEFNFKMAAAKEYSGVGLSHYFSTFSSSINICSLLCLLLGISNISRYLGIGTALIAMPIIMIFAFLSFLTINNLTFLFALMIGSKAINYSLNGPVSKQLYIPTSTDVRFRCQAWIETFGIRISKQAGSLFNIALAPLQTVFGASTGYFYYLILTTSFVFPLIGVWIWVSIFLSRAFYKATGEESRALQPTETVS